MQKGMFATQRLLVAGCGCLVIFATGCRTAMPKWRLFSFGSKPTPEMLAGEGPSTQYPPPPGESASPNAIASSAAGITNPSNAAASIAQADVTSTPSAAELGIPATAAANTSAPNFAAAGANGYNLGLPSTASPSSTAPSTAGLPGYALPGAASQGSTVPAIPTGHRLGMATPDTAPAGSAYAVKPDSMASGLQLPGSGSTPSGPSAPAIPNLTNGASGAGFSLPDNMAALPGSTSVQPTNQKPFTPKLPADASTATAELATPSIDLGSPAGPALGVAAPSEESITTASLSDTFSSPPSSGSSASSTSSSGFSPGSTSGAMKYPATSGYPSTGTSGSFYR